MCKTEYRIYSIRSAQLCDPILALRDQTQTLNNDRHSQLSQLGAYSCIACSG